MPKLLMLQGYWFPPGLWIFIVICVIREIRKRRLLLPEQTPQQKGALLLFLVWQTQILQLILPPWLNMLFQRQKAQELLMFFRLGLLRWDLKGKNLLRWGEC